MERLDRDGPLGVTGVVWLVMPAMQRGDARRLRRSVEANQDLLAARPADGIG